MAWWSRKGSNAKYWWGADKKVIHEAVFSAVRKIDEQSDYEQIYAHWLSLLHNRRYSGLTPGNLEAGQALFPARDDRLVFNTLLNISETLAARICVNKPRPRHITKDAGWSLREQAKKLDQYVEGCFYQNDAYDEGVEVFRDGAWTGTGFLKVFDDGDRVGIERVNPVEILVDETRCLHRNPRSMFQRKHVPAEVVLAMFPDDMRAIEQAVDARSTTLIEGAPMGSDLVEVIEAWHLPSVRGADDGKHVITIGTKCLFDEKWELARHPFAVYRWTTPRIGFYGQGLVEQLFPIQAERNKMALRMQEAARLYATIFCVAEEGSVKADQLGNRIGKIIWKKPGAPDPNIVAPPSMPSDLFGYQDALKREMSETSGVSQMAQTGTKPPGVESGVAMRELQNIQDHRWGLAIKAWEKLFLDASELVVATARLMHKRGGSEKKLSVRYTGKDYFEEIDWSEVNLDEQSYVLQLYPTNILPATPAGKLATVQELLGAGFIDQETANALLDFPDLEAHQSLYTAMVNAIDKAAERMIYQQKRARPEPNMNLKLGIQRMGLHLLNAQNEDVPEDRLNLLRDWMAVAEAMVQEAMAASAPPPEAGPPPEMMPPPPDSVPPQVAQGGAGVPPEIAAGVG